MWKSTSVVGVRLCYKLDESVALRLKQMREPRFLKGQATMFFVVCSKLSEEQPPPYFLFGHEAPIQKWVVDGQLWDHDGEEKTLPEKFEYSDDLLWYDDDRLRPQLICTWIVIAAYDRDGHHNILWFPQIADHPKIPEFSQWLGSIAGSYQYDAVVTLGPVFFRNLEAKMDELGLPRSSW